MLKNETKEKRKNKTKKTPKKIRLKKYNLKNTTKEYNKKKERPNKGVGERGGGGHIKIFVQSFCLNHLVFSS